MRAVCVDLASAQDISRQQAHNAPHPHPHPHTQQRPKAHRPTAHRKAADHYADERAKHALQCADAAALNEQDGEGERDRQQHAAPQRDRAAAQQQQRDGRADNLRAVRRGVCACAYIVCQSGAAHR
jgi:hypothetical protein